MPVDIVSENISKICVCDKPEKPSPTLTPITDKYRLFKYVDIINVLNSNLVFRIESRKID